MIELIEKIKSGIANSVLISGDLQLERGPENAPSVDLHSGINRDDTIMLKKRRKKHMKIVKEIRKRLSVGDKL